MQPVMHDELRGTDRLWCRQLQLCEGEMQCGSLDIITAYNGYKTAVITLRRKPLSAMNVTTCT
jgi:hypothetical protein